MSGFNHISVLKNEALLSLNILPDGLYIDATLGGGGHSLEIAKRLSEKGRLIGIDRDEDALYAAAKNLEGHGDKITLVRNRFSELKSVLDECFLGAKADGILIDLGVSSFQLDTKSRGFSYINDAKLDMRMDNRQELSALDIVNTYSQDALTDIIYRYGEDRFAKIIAQKIVQARQGGEITTTGQLADIICDAYPAKFKVGRGHPAKKTFQAIRIECNQELEELKSVLELLPECIAPKGRAAIITFHSLEDRLVKNTFKRFEQPCVCPPNFAVCICGKKPLGRIITKKPIVPSKDEVAQNKRAASSKLRVFEFA